MHNETPRHPERVNESCTVIRLSFLGLALAQLAQFLGCVGRLCKLQMDTSPEDHREPARTPMSSDGVQRCRICSFGVKQPAHLRVTALRLILLARARRCISRRPRCGTIRNISDFVVEPASSHRLATSRGPTPPNSRGNCDEVPRLPNTNQAPSHAQASPTSLSRPDR